MAQGETAVTGFASRKADALFVYLACNPRPHPRETLATLLWPDNDQTRALANLSVILSSLRKQLGNYLLANRHTVGINTDANWGLDVATFENAIQAAQKRQQADKITRTVAAQLQTAVSHYKGDFLAGFNVRGVPEFEAWVLLEQERLRQMMIDALADLITFHQQRGQFSDGIQQAQRLLALDPLQEEAHRQLLLLYALNNQRPAALAQYEQCAAILADELGVEPDEETTQLYEEIRDDTVTRQENATLAAGHPFTRSPLHNLPTPTTKFIGREAELAHIENWLAEPNGRLLTIIGPGGMGKTRLAQEAARKQLGEFADGVWIVSLVAFSDLNGAVTAVAEAMEIPLSSKQDVPAQLLTQLKTREMLLVLDNLEHLLRPDLQNFLSQLTQEAPEVRLIATSRARLNLQAESLLELRGLSFPSQRDPHSAIRSEPFTEHPLSIAEYPSVQLFSNRVQRIQAEFDLGRQETAVAHLCQLVGGLPLALELAATWTRVLNVAEIVTEIQRGLDALSTTLHDVPERHRSLRAVMTSSWQMFSAAEQLLFMKLAVFRGGFTRAAAQEVAMANLPQLMSLVDRSFLRLDGDQRFRRHPLLLQFAQEQLAAQPDKRAQAEAAHARFFADFVQQHEPNLKGADAPQTLAILAADLENIRAAWQWGLAQLDTAVLENLVGGIARFFGDRSRFLEGTAVFEHSLKVITAQPATPALEPILAKIQVELGRFWHENGRFPEAEAILRQADRLTQQHQLTDARIDCLRQLGVVTDDQGNRQAAHRYLEEALQLCRAAGDPDQIPPILNALGNLCVSDGTYDQARDYFNEAMLLSEAAGNTLRVAILRNNIGIIANRQDNYQEAIRQWQQALTHFEALAHDIGQANANHNIAMAFAGLEQYDEALAYIEAATAVHQRIGHRRGLVGGLSVMGTIYRKLGKRQKARRYLNDSLLLAQEVGVIWSAVATLVEIAELEMSYGELEQAARLLAFAVGHEAPEATTRENAQTLLAELQAELPPDLMLKTKTAVATLTLDELIAQLTQAS
ncbi:MAG: transcriptional activator [Ardenticatenaceae bacterium]|nr:MAG: transcriptional activator [Ardenticatenaceae bacterium]